MATAIIYYSKHHGNTKKILDAIATASPEVELVDATEKKALDLNKYDKIGFASGIYYGKFAAQVMDFAKDNLPADKKVFFIATAGNPMNGNFKSIAEIAKEKQCNELGRYQCKGFDTYGPFKLVGGIQKGHPTQEEIQEAVKFYQGL